jgi:hypothetical protein
MTNVSLEGGRWHSGSSVTSESSLLGEPARLAYVDKLVHSLKQKYGQLIPVEEPDAQNAKHALAVWGIEIVP